MAVEKAIVNIEMASGEIVDGVRLTNRARIAAELQGSKRGWPPPEQSSALRTTYAIFEQLRVDGQIPKDADWKHFYEVDLVDFDIVPDPDAEPDENGKRPPLTEDVDPTPPATAGDYASQSLPPPDSTSTDSMPPTTKS